MFIVLLSYKEKLEIIDQHLVAHRAYLDEGYQKNFLIASGPQNPRIGGVLLSQLNDRTILDAFLKNDPFYLHKLVDYQIIEFTPVKHHPDFSSFIEKYTQSDSFLGEAPKLEQPEFITINEDCEMLQATKHKDEARRV